MMLLLEVRIVGYSRRRAPIVQVPMSNGSWWTEGPMPRKRVVWHNDRPHIRASEETARKRGWRTSPPTEGAVLSRE